MSIECFFCAEIVEAGDELPDTSPTNDFITHRECFRSTWGHTLPAPIIDQTFNTIFNRKDTMALPENEEFIETIFKTQKFVAVTGHCQQLGIPANTEAYRMNIKLDLDVELTPEQQAAFTKEVFDACVAKAKNMWPWIDDVQRAGKNNGWAVITKKGAGIAEWNSDYRKMLEEDKPEEDILGMFWMLIQKRLEDLEAIAEFTKDEVKTAERYVHEWLQKSK